MPRALLHLLTLALALAGVPAAAGAAPPDVPEAAPANPADGPHGAGEARKEGAGEARKEGAGEAPGSASGEAEGSAGAEVPAASAAPTRAAAWIALRERKRGQVAPYRRGRLERALLAFEKGERPSLLELNLGGVYPQLTTLSSGAHVAAGARLWRPDLGGSPYDLHASALFTPRRYVFLDLQAGRIAHRGRRLPQRSTKGDDVHELGNVKDAARSRLIAYGSARYRYFPREDFFGLGSRSRRADRSDFRLEDLLVEGVGGWRLGPRAAVTARAGLLEVGLGRGRDDRFPDTARAFDEAGAPGLERQPGFLRLVAQLLLDGRDVALNPHRGGMLALSYTRFEERGGGAFDLDRLALDARGYLTLGSPQRLLALRAYASSDEADAGARVPFYLQEALGGSHTLRGFPSFRFRGERLLDLQAEYRWEAVPALELALFLDAGQAARRREELALSRLRTDGGFGLRVKLPDAVVLRLDLARGGEGTRFYVRFGPAW